MARAERINHGSVKYRTRLPIGTPAPWARGYRALEHKAVMGFKDGWNNVRGTTPDDLAQGVWGEFVTHLEERSYEDSIRLASHGLGQDLINLYTKMDQEEYAEDFAPGPLDDGDDLEWQWEDSSHDLVPRYFHPDTVDRLSEVLTPRELEVMVLVYEEDRTPTQAAQALGISTTRERALRTSALAKIKKEGLRF